MSTQELNLAPSQTALLVIHLQPDIVSAHTAFGGMFNPQVVERNVLAKAKEAMDTLRTAGGVVVPLRIAFQEDYADLIPSIPLLAMAQQAGSLKDGTADADYVPEIGVQDTDLAMVHKRPGPFTCSDLEAQLRERGITNVIVCGVATNASVEGTVRQASDLGFNTFVLEDASSAADQGAHDAAIASMGLFGAAISVAQMKAALQ